jgi:hypothetical protein
LADVSWANKILKEGREKEENVKEKGGKTKDKGQV